MATARAASRARAMSSSSMISPETPATPRLLMEDTWAPARLTMAPVISTPEVASAFWTDFVIACAAAERSTITPFLIPSEGSTPDPRMRMALSSTRPTRVQTLVVPTSIPTTISSIGYLLLLIEWCIQVFHADERGLDALPGEVVHHRLVDLQLHLDVFDILAEVDRPAPRVLPAHAILRVISHGDALGDIRRQGHDGLDHLRLDEDLVEQALLRVGDDAGGGAGGGDLHQPIRLAAGHEGDTV